MDFATTPPPPLEYGKSLQHFETIVGDPFTRESANFETLMGSVSFGNVSRHVSITFTSDQAFSFEINNIELGDTFLGIPIPMRAVKFRNELKRKGVVASGDPDGVYIPDCGVSFYIYEGEIATICWETAKPGLAIEGGRKD